MTETPVASVVSPLLSRAGVAAALAATFFFVSVEQDLGLDLYIGYWSLPLFAIVFLTYALYAAISLIVFILGLHVKRLFPLFCVAIFLLTLFALARYGKPHVVQYLGSLRLAMEGAPADKPWMTETLSNGDRISWTGWGGTTGFTLLNAPINTIIRYDGREPSISKRVQYIEASDYYKNKAYNMDSLHIGPLNNSYFIHQSYCCH